MPHAGNATNLSRRGGLRSLCHDCSAPAWRRFARCCHISGPSTTPAPGPASFSRWACCCSPSSPPSDVPVVYGRIVDALAPKDSTALLAIPLALVIGYGLLRVGSAAFGELRDALFAKVQQRAVRIAARRTFQPSARAQPALPSRSPDRRAGPRDRSRHRRASSRCCGSRCSTWCRRSSNCCWSPRSSGTCSTGASPRSPSPRW